MSVVGVATPALAQSGADKPGEWPMAARDYENTRFSPLDQIKTDNAKDLKVAWTFSTGVNRGQEAAPIVVGDTMYVVTPYPNILYALQLLDPKKDPEKRSYALKWKYEPKPMAAAMGVACCDYVNRGVVFHDNKIYYNTLDAHTVCVDANTGSEVWKTKVGEINIGETTTMAPIVAKGKVIVGNSGGEFGVRGWLKGLDASTGKVAWTAHATGPDKDVLIGERFKPFYEQYKGTDLGVKNWPPGQWEVGGGTAWGFISYDPSLDLIYYGTANPGTWNAELRPGDNNWTCGVFARDPDDGQAVWFYQWTPHDLFDWDGINENVLVDLAVDGPDKPKRKVLLHVDRNGLLYVVDRTNGQVISATVFTRNTALLPPYFDEKTARPIHNPEKHPQTNKVIRDVQPFAPGAKDWQPTAFSPQTGYLYVPHQNMSMDFEGVEVNYIAGTPYVGAITKFYGGPGGNRGVFMAWDPIAKKAVWSLKERFPVWSGAMVTKGDVVFYGNMEGVFKAINAKTGEELFQFKTGSGIIGQPITYTGPDGKQYVAILSGVGGWAGAIVVGNLDPGDPTAAKGMVNATKDLPDHTTTGGDALCLRAPLKPPSASR